MNLDVKFELGQKVKVIPCGNKVATVEGYYYSYYGLKYYVTRYNDNFETQDGYFYDKDLVAVE